LPIYECPKCGNFEVVGSKKELKEKATKGWDSFEGHTPHRPWVDDVKIKCAKCGEVVSRIEDVGNPWLDAGIVPYSTITKDNQGEPLYLSNKKEWEQWFPVDFITESFPGQFKNWFYAMIAESTVLENVNPYKTVLGFASVRDEKGEEMHKSKGNAIWFDEAAEEIGVDVMRWMYARQNPVQNLNFGYGAANEVRRKMLTLWNVYSFFATYASIDKWNPDTANEIPVGKRSVLDRWILSELTGLIEYSSHELSSYRAHTYMERVEKFIEDLSTWYVRRSRRRFWKSDDDADKNAAYHTLYMVLTQLSLLLAPVVPHLSEEIYQNLKAWRKGKPASVHLSDWPKADKSQIDKELESNMEIARETINAVLSLRAEQGIKVRQPLMELKVSVDLPDDLLYIVAEEVNVKEVTVKEKKGALSVELDTKITQELKNEGIARDFVRSIQEGRKKAGFNVEDRILTNWQTSSKEIAGAIKSQSEYVAKETLSVEFAEGKKESEYEETVKLGGGEVWFGISRKK
jgi:isoleucyl-tRNA synthetase